MTSWIRIPVAGVAVLASLALVTGPAAGSTGTGTYVPFKTDFPKGASPSQTYTPFVTDFAGRPRPAGPTVAIHASPRLQAQQRGSLDWADVAIGAGLGLAFAGALAATALVVQTRRRTAVPSRVGNVQSTHPASSTTGGLG